jgi:hypothetical protein
MYWQGMREDFFRRSGLPSATKQVPEYLARRLGKAYERFLKTAPSNTYAVCQIPNKMRLNLPNYLRLRKKSRDIIVLLLE